MSVIVGQLIIHLKFQAACYTDQAMAVALMLPAIQDYEPHIYISQWLSPHAT